MLWLISFARANLDCKERKPRIKKWTILAHAGTRTHDPWFSSLVPYPLRHAVWHTNDNLKLIQLSSFARVLHNSTQKHRKIRHFSRGIWLIIHDLHYLILTFLHKNHSFSLLLPSEAIAIDELGSIALKLHTYTTFFLLKFNFHKKLQVIVGYRFFVCLVYYMYPRTATDREWHGKMNTSRRNIVAKLILL